MTNNTDHTDPTDGIGEAWERGVAGPLAEFLTAFARGVAARPDSYSDDLVDSARAVLATAETPAPTLAEGLRSIREWVDWEAFSVFDEIVARAEEIEQGRNELSAELTRTQGDLSDANDLYDQMEADCNEMRRERDEARSEVRSLQFDKLEGLTAFGWMEQAKGYRAEMNAATVASEENLASDQQANMQGILAGSLPDPADVKPGEAWAANIWYGDEQYSGIAIKSAGGDWNVCRDEGTHSTYRMNEYVELIARLVPAPRVITNTDELEALPHRTVIRDSDGDMFQRIAHGWYQAGYESVHRSDDNFVCLPVTVLWEPGA